jgi:hypothetical protein
MDYDRCTEYPSLDQGLRSRLTAPLAPTPSVGGLHQLAIEIHLQYEDPDLTADYGAGTPETSTLYIMYPRDRIAAAQIKVWRSRGEAHVYVSLQIGDSVVFTFLSKAHATITFLCPDT